MCLFTCAVTPLNFHRTPQLMSHFQQWYSADAHTHTHTDFLLSDTLEGLFSMVSYVDDCLLPQSSRAADWRLIIGTWCTLTGLSGDWEGDNMTEATALPLDCFFRLVTPPDTLCQRCKRVVNALAHNNHTLKGCFTPILLLLGSLMCRKKIQSEAQMFLLSFLFFEPILTCVTHNATWPLAFGSEVRLCFATCG